MDKAAFRVFLTMEASLLSSVLQQLLAFDPRLDIQLGDSVRSSGIGPAGVLAPETGAVEIHLLDAPPRFELTLDGTGWTVHCANIDGLTSLLANLEHRVAVVG